MSRRVLRWGGVVLTASALALLVLIGYQVVLTNTWSAEAADAARVQLSRNWSEPTAEASHGVDPSSIETMPTPRDDSAFGLVYIPRLRSKAWAQPLIQGVEKKQLDAGIGHFPDSALPGEVGNFAIAGHRATHGEPLAFIDKVQAGDQVIVRTKSAWYVYTMRKTAIVKPEEVWVVDPVPGTRSKTPTHRIITVVTCEPRWGSTSRWIWWGELTATYEPHATPPVVAAYGA